MGWQSYQLDQKAQELVIAAKKRDSDSLNQAFKMRMAIAYGLERFWGEQLRLIDKEPQKAAFWQDTWQSLVKILEDAGVKLPNDDVDPDDTNQVETMAKKFWGEMPLDNEGTKLTLEDQRLALAVLTQLCDAIIWWRQRLK